MADYTPTLHAMTEFTQARGPNSDDELWLCEHPAVFTQGLAGKIEHVLHSSTIPVVQTNRGGQVTYHGPGQVVAYPLADLTRLKFYAKEFVYRLETAAIQTLNEFGVTGHRVAGAPGIYVRLDDPFGHAALQGPFDAHDPFRGLAKIAALGIKITRVPGGSQCTYHGASLNVAMDLSPYEFINPCGYAGLRTVDLATLGVLTDWATVAPVFGERLCALLSV